MIDIPDTGQEWPFHLSPIPYRPEDEQDWRRSILSGIAFGPRFHPDGPSRSVSSVPVSIANAGDV